MPGKSTHKLDAFLPRLGKEPDHKIAAEAGVSRSLIISYRKKHGIVAYDGYKFGADNPPPAARAAAAAGKAPRSKVARKSAAAGRAVAAKSSTFRGRRSALDAYVEMLGKVPDADIAKLADVTPENVRTYRTRRGIAASWPEAGKGRGGRPKGSSASRAKDSTAPRSVFSVAVDVGGTLRTYAIVAGTITDGVAIANSLVAKKHPGAVVKGLTHVAEFLG